MPSVYKSNNPDAALTALLWLPAHFRALIHHPCDLFHKICWLSHVKQVKLKCEQVFAFCTLLRSTLVIDQEGVAVCLTLLPAHLLCCSLICSVLTSGPDGVVRNMF